jgi:hypothetical protein
VTTPTTPTPAPATAPAEGGAPTAPTPAPSPGEGWIPKARFDQVNTEAGQLRQQLQELQVFRTNYERMNSLPAPMRDERFVTGFGAQYDHYRRTAGDSALPFGDWVNGPARQDPFLAPHFASLGAPAAPAAPAAPSAPTGPTAPAAPQGPAVAPAPAAPAAPAPVVDRGSAPPAPPQALMTPEQVAQHLSSLTPQQASEWVAANADLYGLSQTVRNMFAPPAPPRA